MKNIIKWSAAAIFASALLASCTGRVVELKPVDTEAYNLVLKADTYAIIADGEDYVQFTVTLNGEDITSEAKIYDTATDEVLSEGASFTSTTAGEVTFSVDYSVEDDLGVLMPVPCNTQTIKVVANETAKVFYRNCGVVRLTGTWCSPCYVLGQTFNSALTQFPDRTVVVMAHVNNTQSPDPYANEATEAAALELFDLTGQSGAVPQVSFDFRDHTANSKVAESLIATYLTNSIEGHPANCGIQASSTLSGTTATIDVEVTATAGKEYFLTVALIEENIKGRQRDAENVWLENYAHNNVLRSFGETSLYGVSLGTITADATATKSLTYDLTGYDVANCRFAIFVNYKEGDAYFTDNAAYCPVGGAIRYSYDA